MNGRSALDPRRSADRPEPQVAHCAAPGQPLRPSLDLTVIVAFKLFAPLPLEQIMTNPKSMSDEAFLAAFLDCSMPPAGFNHHGHIRVAWLLLRRFPLEEAVCRTCDGIGRLAAHLGAAGKYNHTLTEALVRLMAHGGAADPSLSWDDFLRQNHVLVSDARRLLGRYYSEECLSSPEARSRSLPPDRQPLPA